MSQAAPTLALPGPGQASSPAPWRRAALAGYALILLFFGGFGGWAATAPLGSAVIAQGQLKVDTSRKTIQPFTTGVVSEILVREGQSVKEGDVLIRLDRARAESELDVFVSQLNAARAQEARLLAERDRLPEIRFPASLLDHQNEPEVAKLMQTQRSLFEAKRATLEGQTNILRERIAQTQTQIDAMGDRRQSLVKQLALIRQELSGVRDLHAKGLERLPRVLGLERQTVSLEGDIANTDASVAQAKQRIGEMELQIIDLRQQADRTTSDELRTIAVTLNDLEHRAQIARDALRWLVIAAPRSGKVVDLRVHTVGGVVTVGQPLMDIVPEGDDLIVEGQVSLRDIDSVRVGAKVQVRLTSFSQRYTHPIDATLVSVSADSIQNPQTGMPYYRALIRLDKESRDRVLPDVELSSGMPAMAMISVGERTLLEYWMSPLLQSFDQALREP